MIVWAYDKTFEGLLTLVFETYDRRISPDKIVGYAELSSFMLCDKHEVITDVAKAERVWNGLQKKLSKGASNMVFILYLSELANMEMLILNFCKKAIASNISIENNFGDETVLDALKIYRKVSREAQRMLMFVRFQKTADNIFYASIDPKYNVLPLIIKHFETRYADQQWIIYDTHRKYGFFYDLNNVVEVRFEDSMINPISGQIDPSIMASDEKLFQDMWKKYFDTLCIKERINKKLHMQMLPKRFWKYLPEKNKLN